MAAFFSVFLNPLIFSSPPVPLTLRLIKPLTCVSHSVKESQAFSWKTGTDGRPKKYSVQAFEYKIANSDTFIQQGFIKLIKSDSKDIYIKYFYFKYMSDHSSKVPFLFQMEK